MTRQGGTQGRANGCAGLGRHLSTDDAREPGPGAKASGSHVRTQASPGLRRFSPSPGGSGEGPRSAGSTVRCVRKGAWCRSSRSNEVDRWCLRGTRETSESGLLRERLVQSAHQASSRRVGSPRCFLRARVMPRTRATPAGRRRRIGRSWRQRIATPSPLSSQRELSLGKWGDIRDGR